MNDFKDINDYKNSYMEYKKNIEEKGARMNREEFLQLMEAEAKSGDPNAQLLLGATYDIGELVPKDLEKALYWVEKAAQQDHPIAQRELASIYYFDGENGKPDYEKAAYWARKAADQNDDLAQVLLAWCYSGGNGVEKDFKQAAYWFQKAADQGYAVAQAELAALYANGQGVQRSISTAVDLYRKAAEQGNTHAMMNLGRWLEQGDADAKNLAAAIEWYEKAVAAGKNDAQEALDKARKTLKELQDAEERKKREDAEFQKKLREQAIKEARDASMETTAVISTVLFVLSTLLAQWAGEQEGKLTLLICAYAAQVIFGAGALGFGLGSFTSTLGAVGAVLGAAGGLAAAILSNTKPNSADRIKLYAFAAAAVIAVVMILRITTKKSRPKS